MATLQVKRTNDTYGHGGRGGRAEYLIRIDFIAGKVWRISILMSVTITPL
jgi:hypothetical protein